MSVCASSRTIRAVSGVIGTSYVLEDIELVDTDTSQVCLISYLPQLTSMIRKGFAWHLAVLKVLESPREVDRYSRTPAQSQTKHESSPQDWCIHMDLVTGPCSEVVIETHKQILLLFRNRGVLQPAGSVESCLCAHLFCRVGQHQGWRLQCLIRASSPGSRCNLCRSGSNGRCSRNVAVGEDPECVVAVSLCICQNSVHLRLVVTRPARIQHLWLGTTISYKSDILGISSVCVSLTPRVASSICFGAFQRSSSLLNRVMIFFLTSHSPFFTFHSLLCIILVLLTSPLWPLPCGSSLSSHTYDKVSSFFSLHIHDCSGWTPRNFTVTDPYRSSTFLCHVPMSPVAMEMGLRS